MRKQLFFILAVLLCSFTLRAQEAGKIDRETFLFAVKGTDSLYLDKYDDPAFTGVKPCVIFLFGGGFWTGWRSADGYVPFYHFLARQGYTVITPDYRLLMKDVRGKKLELSPDEFGTVFLRAQDAATEDLFDATRYVLDHAGAWGIDPEMILTSGSSAGAITALNGEHQLCNRTPMAAERLPEDFDYAGVMAFAGAIFRDTQELQWARKPCPILMFHGNADEAVPYNGKTVGRFGYFGSKALAGEFRRMQTPYYFYAAENMNHDMAGTPMVELRPAILDFLQRFVKEKKPLMIDVNEVCTDRPDRKKDYSWRDYIFTCFGPVLKDNDVR